MPHKLFKIRISQAVLLAIGVSFFSGAFAAPKPSGSTTAGGDLMGTYPNPQIAPSTIGSTELIDMPELVPGSYTNPVIQIDQDGRITSASSGNGSSSVVDENQHIKLSGSAPTVFCGGAIVANAVGTDNAGWFSVPGLGGTVAVCTLNFANPYTGSGPSCVLTAGSGNSVPLYIQSSTLDQYVVSRSTGLVVGEKIFYHCFQL